jgi:hypothetical protein
VEKNGPGVIAREPSFTAMWHAWLRNTHATVHPSPRNDRRRNRSPSLARRGIFDKLVRPAWKGPTVHDITNDR